ncbi:guanine nucleotide exchange factor Srm1p [Trichomonascus vanleenenianus]|uniref:RCC1-like domain-containing protein n=1 Tax=Trichomonascus vanleenenianus TaxID=2268995 RepID=UPI003ECA4372
MPPRKREAAEANGPVKRARLDRSTPEAAAPSKARRTPSAARRAARGTSITRSGRERLVINEIAKLPEERANVYCFGSGSICELGLGPRVLKVMRPRLNPLLPIDEVGIVKVAVGGAHVLAIDHEGKLWSWGQNDSGALGRPSKVSDDELDEDDDLNPKESSPGRVENVPANAVFVDIAATDSLSAAVTADGHLYAWGTFIDDGDKAFRPGTGIQDTPLYISQLRGVVQVAGGKDHLLILDKFGDVHAWGIGQSFQLGHKVNARLRTKTFGPLKVVGLKSIISVAAGEYHSFAIDKDHKLWAWGLNNFGQCFVPEESGDGKSVEKPTLVTFFDDTEIVQVDGGSHHSLALTKDGDVYAVGETNFHQIGIENSELPKEFTVYEQDGTTPAYLFRPTKITKALDAESNSGDEKIDMPKMKFIACGVDHSMALGKEDGSAWTWGFGEVFQLGHGKPAGEDEPEDEPIPKKIYNTATRGVNMVGGGAGGQFSVLVGLPKEE